MQPLLDIKVGGDFPADYAELSPDNRCLAVLNRNGSVSVFDSAVADQQVPGPTETKSDQTVELDVVGDLSGGIHRSLPAGISADGTLVVGRSSHSEGVSPFVWSKTDGIRPLGSQYPDGLHSDCKCVSADRSVFGESHGTIQIISGAELVQLRLFYGFEDLGKDAVRMARVNRRDVLTEGEVQLVHCVNRRGFLCSDDPLTGMSYDHRRQ